MISLCTILWLVSMPFAAADPVVELPGTDRVVVFEGTPDAAIEDAMAALASGRFDAAASAFGALAGAGENVDARYLEALARYEAGDLSGARWAAERGLDRDGDHVALLSLHGLILADVGLGDDALVRLARAERLAVGDAAALERIAINQRLVRIDRGEEASDPAHDPLGDLAEDLRRGDTQAAAKHVPTEVEGNRRTATHSLLGQAAVARAEGRLDDAAVLLDKALGLARQGGLVRERAAALAEVGAVYALSGHHELALDNLLQAVGLVSGTSFRVNEVAFRAETGRVAVRLGQLDQARAQLAGARKVVPEGTRFPGAARIDELAGLIYAREGKAAEANAAFERAVNDLNGRGYWADSGRVATAAVELAATANDAAGIKQWSVAANGAFDKAGDPVGAAHVLMAVGLGRVRARDFEGAMEAFAQAATKADAAATPRGASVAAVARANAAETLVVLGHSRRAGEFGLDDAVARHGAFSAAEDRYGAGLKAFEAKDWTASYAAFDSAYQAFTELDEGAYAIAARRGRAWSSWNAAQSKDPTAALAVFAALQEEGVQVGDPELELRAGAAYAIAMARSGEPRPKQLQKWAQAAEAMGLLDVAVTCWSELAEHDDALLDRVRSARHAHALSPGTKSAYALYSTAIDAFNAEEYTLAGELAHEALPAASDDLKPAIQEVIDNLAAAEE